MEKNEVEGEAPLEEGREGEVPSQIGRKEVIIYYFKKKERKTKCITYVIFQNFHYGLWKFLNDERGSMFYIITNKGESFFMG